MAAIKKLKTCSQGHQFYKSTDCPTCPICEKEHIPVAGFLAQISAPARRALEGANIYSLEKLATFTANELLKLHGFGPRSLPKLRMILQEVGLKLKSE